VYVYKNHQLSFEPWTEHGQLRYNNQTSGSR
jgi:hypothetical protein